LKPLARDPVKHDVIELLAAVGHQAGFKLGDPASEDQFIDLVRKSVRVSRTNAVLLYGRRTEAMFAYIAAALGDCILVKSEDSGNAIVSDDAIKIPDYRLVTKAGRHLLVEVKNRHGDKLALTKRYVANLAAYAKLAGCELKLAVYWSRNNRWTLLCPEKLPLYNGQYTLTDDQAICINEMSEIGDFGVVTATPILVRVFVDQSKPQQFDKSTNNFRATVERLEIYCQDRLIETEIEREIAMFLLKNAELVKSGWVANVAGEEVVSLDQSFEVRDRDMVKSGGFGEFLSGGFAKFGREAVEPSFEVRNRDKVDFIVLGIYSSMLSNEYIYRTSSSSGVASFIPNVNPSELGVRIPVGYAGDYLPIVRLAFEPNYDLLDIPPARADRP
jgi:Holliday junction resolvase